MPSQRRAGSASSSFTAFAFAVAGAAVASRLVFDHQPPRQPEEVPTYLATLGIAVIAGWWLANVAAWAGAIRRGVQLDRFTLPGTKRIAQFVLAATLSTSCVADASTDPVMILVEQGQGASSTAVPPTTSPPTTSPSTTVPPITSPSTLPGPPDAPTIEAESTAPEPVEVAASTHAIENHQVVVNEGDNLWSLAAETLILHGVEEPSCEQIASYWRTVVAANQVRSGNVDLITPGEPITMPSFDLSGFEPNQPRPAPRSPASGIGAR